LFLIREQIRPRLN